MKRLTTAAVLATAAVGLAACGGSSSGGTPSSTGSTPSTSESASAGALPDLSGQTIEVAAEWQKDEQKSFEQVLKKFEDETGAKIQYTSTGDQTATILGTRVAGGNPPDVALIPQPGLIQQFVDKGVVQPLPSSVQDVVTANFGDAWQQLGTFNGKLYALPFKAANKSVVWYNVPAFKAAGVTPPKSLSQLLKDAGTIKASGTPAYSIGGADGWTLTDMFENIYLRTFGSAKYNALSQHKIKWTDKSVTTALKTMAKIIGDTSNVYGGTSGALQYGFNDSVTNAFGSPPKAAMVFEADFVGGVIASSTKSKPGTGFNTFAWPSIKPGPNASAVEIAGDLFVTFRDTPAIRAFVQYLASPQAATIWAKEGGFGTGNHNVPASVYPDPITRATEAPILSAKQVVFDMSDEQPPAFGATTGQGEWGLFQQFLKNPKDVSGIQKKLESAAAKAYKK
jgi:ABC-type glycerol-3-phosphate transport system substrate-binding protein